MRGAPRPQHQAGITALSRAKRLQLYIHVWVEIPAPGLDPIGTVCQLFRQNETGLPFFYKGLLLYAQTEKSGYFQ